MIRTKILISFILFSIISGCGFHTPHKNESINATIKGHTESMIAKKIVKRLNKNIPPSLIIEIAGETMRQDVISYDNSGKESGYRLNYLTPVKVYNKENVLIFEDVLSAKSIINKIGSYQADKLQINETYEILSDNLVRKFIRQLNRLNES